jgi:WD40 repeat protein
VTQAPSAGASQQEPPDAGRRHDYDVFISYAHATDTSTAEALHHGLQSFAKPWHRRRAVRIFRDTATLAANPALWPTIENAIKSSRFLLLLASTAAAESTWITRELQTFLTVTGTSRLLIVLVDGTIAWDQDANDFDWDSTSALPSCLRGAFESEPLYVDLRPLKTAPDPGARASHLTYAVATLSAAVRGVAKDDLIGEDLRLHRKAMWLARAVAIALALLATAALWSAYRLRQSLYRVEDSLAESYFQEYLHAASPRHGLAALAAAHRISPRRTDIRAHLFRTLGLATWPLPVARFRQPGIGRGGVHLSTNGASVVLTDNSQFATLFDVRSGRPTMDFRPVAGSEQIQGISPDLQRVLTLTSEGQACVSEMLTRRRTACVTGVRAIVGSDMRTDQTLFIGSDESGLAYWSVGPVPMRRTRLLGFATAVEDITGAAFSRGGSLVAVATAEDDGGRRKQIYLWDARTGRRLLAPLRFDGFNSVGFDVRPDGDRLLVFGERIEDLGADQGTALLGAWELWAIGADGSARRIAGHKSDAPEFTSKCGAFSPDGRSFVVALNAERAEIYSADTGASENHSASLQDVACATFPSNHRVLTWSHSGDAQINDLELSEPVMAATVPSPLGGACSAECEYLAAATNDEVSVWDARPGRLEPDSLPLDAPALSVAENREGTLLAVGTEKGSVVLYDSTSFLAIGDVLDHPSAVSHVEFSRDGSSLLALSGQYGYVWNVRHGALIGRTEQLSQAPSSPRRESVVKAGRRAGMLASGFSSDGTRVLAVTDAGKLLVYESRTVRRLPGPNDAEQKSYSRSMPVDWAGMDPCGTVLLTASHEARTLQRWDPTTGRSLGPDLLLSEEDFPQGYGGIGTGHSAIHIAWFNQRCGQAVVALGTRARMLDVEKGVFWGVSIEDYAEQLPIEGAPTSATGFASVALSPDDERILTTSGVSAQMWDVDNGQPVGVTMRHANARFMGAALFTADGGRVVTVGGTSVGIALWDATTGRFLGEFLPGRPSAKPSRIRWRPPLSSQHFNRDGTRLWMIGRGGDVFAWNTTFDWSDAPTMAAIAEAISGYRRDTSGAIRQVDDPTAALASLRASIKRHPDRSHPFLSWLLADRTGRSHSLGPSLTRGKGRS